MRKVQSGGAVDLREGKVERCSWRGKNGASKREVGAIKGVGKNVNRCVSPQEVQKRRAGAGEKSPRYKGWILFGLIKPKRDGTNARWGRQNHYTGQREDLRSAGSRGAHPRGGWAREVSKGPMAHFFLQI